ncbi:MAG: UDP-N-acetylglucosamine 4-epimerase, partial [Prevotellaceae bacterium]|nr:UDP-N-acetylglucosamine 4-epimerase [Prevotellaceae bacterium]
GYCFDILAWMLRKKLPISSVRVKKFCATTQFDSTKARSTEFIPPYTLSQGIDRTIKFEFVHEKKDDIIYVSE